MRPDRCGTGRRFRPDGTLFDLHVRATIDRALLPTGWAMALTEMEWQ